MTNYSDYYTIDCYILSECTTFGAALVLELIKIIRNILKFQNSQGFTSIVTLPVYELDIKSQRNNECNKMSNRRTR